MPSLRTHRRVGVAITASALAFVPLLATTALAAPGGDQVVISELRFRGPTGGNDELVELRNPTASPADISGWRLQGCNTAGSVSDRASVPAGTSIPPGGYYLFANASSGTGGSYSGSVAPDRTYTTGVSDNGGIRLVTAAGAVIDQVGASGSQPCREGTGIAGIPTANGDNAYGRGGGATDTDDNASDFIGPRTANPQNLAGTPSSGDPGSVPDDCGPPVTAQIADIQGDESGTPVAGQVHRIEGVVTGAYGRGVTIEDVTPDADPASSDAVFVFSDTLKTSARAGDVVRVTGRASEFNGLTQLSLVAGSAITCATEQPLPLTRLEFPMDLERVEGMRIRAEDDLVVSELFELAFGEIGVRVTDTVPHTPTEVLDPQDDASAVAAALTLARTTTFNLDDDTAAGRAFVEPFKAVGTLRLGDRFTGGVTGVMDFGFGSWRLQPELVPSAFVDTTTRPAAPPSVGGDVQVASFNVLNYFTVLNTCGSGQASPPCPRGANDAAELERQRAKTVAAIRGLGAEVVGLVEMQNDTAVGVDPGAGVSHLVEGLNEADGADTWAWVLGPNPGTDAIQQAFVYRSAAVRPTGEPVNDSNPSHHRPPLAQRFTPVGGGTPFTVVVNHFKSKGCGGASGLDTDQGDGQGCFNATRVAQVHALSEFIEALGGDALVIGDLNAYSREDPLDELRSRGYVDLEEGGHDYSYLFDGQVGRLDHALAAGATAGRVTGSGTWHINAAEPSLYDYNNPSAAPDPYRSSDHDPVLVGLDLTGPTIAWSGNRPYLVDEQVTVTCEAYDAWTGVASSTCPVAAQGWGYELGLGNHAVVAEAVDHSGNVTTSTTTFTVGVSIPALRNVVLRLVEAAGTERFLVARLDDAARHQQHGNAEARSGSLGAFRNHLDARAGRDISAETARTLRVLVDAV